MGISIDGRDAVKGVDLLLHYYVEMICRGEVVDQGGESFWLVSVVRIRNKKPSSQKGERSTDADDACLASYQPIPPTLVEQRMFQSHELVGGHPK